jgi:Arc/MetJ-type ribon-helix-helix transcriptional regulator
MSIDINPETERLVREEINSGHFRSIDDLIVSGVNAWREKHGSPPAPGGPLDRRTGQDLIDACAKVQGLLTDEEVDTLFARSSCSYSRPVVFE